MKCVEEDEGLKPRINYEDYLYCAWNPHPLLIPSIAKNILQDFSYSELKKFRLVCTPWEYEASGMLLSKTQIRFPTEKHVIQYNSDLTLNYCCESYEFGPDIPLDGQPMRDFFEMFGPDIKSLKLHQVTWKGPLLWSILSQKLPFLEELSLRIFIPRDYSPFIPQGFWDEEGQVVSKTLSGIKTLKLNFLIDKPYKPSAPPPPEVTLPPFLAELLQAVPNVEEIYCPNWPTLIRPSVNVSCLFYKCIFANPSIRLDRLSSIHINAALDNQELYNLTEKGFPLRELRLELHPEVRPFSFYFLLKSLERTLKTLVLIFHPEYDTQDFEDFPTLLNLEYLSMHYFCGPVDTIVKFLPTLKTLLLNDSYVMDSSLVALALLGRQEREDEEGEVDMDDDDDDDDDERQVLPRVVPCPPRNQVEELVLEGRTYNPQGQMRILTRIFPELKRLRVQNVDDEMLRVIFAGMGNLEELVADGKFTDAGISGIPLEVCREIYEVPDVDRVRVFPYIGALQKLRRLSLSSWSISYLSVLLGVNDCKALKTKRISSPQIAPVRN